jgi:hypothetical protein
LKRHCSRAQAQGDAAVRLLASARTEVGCGRTSMTSKKTDARLRKMGTASANKFVSKMSRRIVPTSAYQTPNSSSRPGKSDIPLPLPRPSRLSGTAFTQRKSGIRGQLALVLMEPRSSRSATAFLVVIVSVIAMSTLNFFLSSMPHLHDDETLKTLEFVCAGVLTFELMLRTFVGTLNWKRMLLWEWTYWLDVLSLLPFYLDSRCWTSEINDDELPDEVRSLELLRLLRILKLVRHYADWRVLMVALQNSWRALLVPTFAMLMTILVLSGALFLAEGQPYDRSNPYRPTAEGEFRDGFEAMWTIFWIVTTLGTTTGPGGKGGEIGRIPTLVSAVSPGPTHHCGRSVKRAALHDHADHHRRRGLPNRVGEEGIARGPDEDPAVLGRAQPHQHRAARGVPRVRHLG